MKKYIETVSDENTDILLEYFTQRQYKDGNRIDVTTVRSVLINFDMQSGGDPWEDVPTGKGFHYVGIRLSPYTILHLAKEIMQMQLIGDIPDESETV